MVQENELFLMVVGIVSLTLVLTTSRLKRFPSPDLFVMAFCLLFLGWILTILEGFFAPDLLNLLEHVCYAASSVVAAFWTWKTFVREEPE